MEDRPIIRLTEEIIGKIAAGEVVESPASAIKELVENSLDAGSTCITVEIRDGGISYLRVTDNGKGIPSRDVRLAFERHATSKIRKSEDLFDLHTLGFRGEALASIAAVSKLVLTTRHAGEDSGTRAVNEGGTIKSISEAASPQGTTIVARDLFYNTPVRLKFLKKPVTEAGRVAEVIARMILAHPDISFRLIHNGKQVYSTNSDGKITEQYYNKEPQPGSTVELTIDLDFQQAVEEALAATVSRMSEEDGNEKRGAGAAVVEVGTGAVLSLASYPTFHLATYNQDFNELMANPANPMLNRATQGAYPPGSTFKPLTAVAALESGVITPSQKIKTLGRYTYYAPTYQPACWIYNSYRGTHGSINVVDAINVSCNYFFYEVGRLTGISVLNEYARAFGLGEHTGIEIGDRAGVLAGPDYCREAGIQWSDGQTIAAAIGQSYNLFTPLQLANYIATLVSGGEHYEAHLLKEVSTYDRSQVIYTQPDKPVNTVEMAPSTLSAVKSGMRKLTTTGSLASYFKECVVDAGAKTGTAQLGGDTENNGVFVCFAPYDDPEIAVAIVIEQGGSGSALASTAVEILNAWFTADEIGGVIIGENQLIP